MISEMAAESVIASFENELGLDRVYWKPFPGAK